MKAILISAILLLACNVFDQNALQTQITGKWEIKKVKFPEEYSESSSSKNIMFFGTQVWANAEGKYFQFKEDSIVLTNVFLHNNEPLKLFYKQEDQNVIRIALNKSFDEKSFIMEIEVKDENMVWRIDKALEVSLNKELD
jgi:hypothetical protein